mmetsp:Transcript_13465/g.19933  ORF Transcript_13465/g.19933 Transcript_13465/m.19933 type:complete len:176 (+) Transcript_13465:3269-3796(+)
MFYIGFCNDEKKVLECCSCLDATTRHLFHFQLRRAEICGDDAFLIHFENASYVRTYVVAVGDFGKESNIIWSESRASPGEREPKNDERRRLIFRSVRIPHWPPQQQQQRHFARRHVRLLCVLHGLQRCTAQGHLPPRRQGGAHPHAQRVLQTLAHAPVGRQGGAAPQRTEKRPGV